MSQSLYFKKLEHLPNYGIIKLHVPVTLRDNLKSFASHNTKLLNIYLILIALAFIER